MRTLKNNILINPGLNKFLVLAHSQTENKINFQQQDVLGFQTSGYELPVVQMTPLEENIYFHNLSVFMGLIDTGKTFHHCYDDVSRLNSLPVLSKGWADATDPIFNEPGFTPSRDIKRGTGAEGVSKFVNLFGAVSFNKLSPVYFDRQWRVIDGYNRLNACRYLKMQFYYIQLDL